MKKSFIVFLLVVLTMGTVFAQSISEKAEGMQRVIILNNSFEGLEATSQCYNAKEWHKSYKIGEIIEQNFWFTPADATVSTVSYGDLHTDTCDLATFKGKYVSFVKDNPAYDYDLFVGPNQKESSDVWYKGWCIVGNEAFVFMPEEGITDFLYYAENIGLVPSAGFVFESVSGETVTLTAAELVDAQVVYTGDRVVTLECGSQKLENLYSVTVKEVTKDSKVEGDGVYRMVMLLNAKGVYGVDAPYLQNRAGTYYPTATTKKHAYAGCYSVAEWLAKYDVTPCASVKVISYKDGFSREEEYGHFAKKYIGWHASGEYITLGQEQSKKEDAVFNAGYYILSEDAFAYIPAGGVSVADIFATINMADVCQYKLTYMDGKVELKYAEEVAAMKLAEDSQLVSIEVN